MNLTITWSTEYNGVWVGPEFIEEDDEYNLVEKANDEMELPNLTHEMCSGMGCFDDPSLTKAQIETLKDVVRKNEILKKLYGDFEITFEYDCSST